MMYLKRLLLVTIVAGSVAFAAGLLMDNIYKKRWDTLWFKKTDDLLKTNTNYDIIFLGNSRVHFGINPYYIDSVTKLNSYNFGFGGADAEEFLLTTTLYLQNHPAPKITILSLDAGALTENEILKTRYHYLFYLNNDSLKKFMNRAGFLTTLIKYFPFTKYSFFDEYNRTSLFVKGKTYPVFDHNIYKGFLNIHPSINSQPAALYNVKSGGDKISKAAIGYFKNTVSLLQQKGSRVVFIWPPVKSDSLNEGSSINKTADSLFNAIALQYGVTQFHFEKDSIYKDTYFVDAIHFNEPGTRIYSIKLADSIKSIY